MSKTILMADDEPSLRLLAKASLKSQGFNIIEAVDGQEALDLARATNPDLILLDVMMPHLTGFQVCAELKQDSAIKDTPIAILTAKGGNDDMDTAREAGANFFLTKPFRPNELLKVVHFLLYKYPKKVSSAV